MTSKLLISSLSFKSLIGTDQHHLTSTYLNLSYCRISLCSASGMKPCESPCLRRFAVRLQVVDPISDFLLVSRAGKTSSWKKKSNFAPLPRVEMFLWLDWLLAPQRAQVAWPCLLDEDAAEVWSPSFHTVYSHSLYYGQTREVNCRQIRNVVLDQIKVSFQIFYL